ncbi:chitinase [Pseudoxanthobacter soli DSM 19599]|uniref:cellulase n=1 Tax=Pseudoxanthobacter soli DSM 19599 TaxID=1123029 RepID=A0A1M7ZQX3_9HYPH|nr:Calx-beta domain-containing protein [Pseudoxanthobacter soli]SHO67271.1 chitinase [Pseudoxanthobacter soli DSM 19599]
MSDSTNVMQQADAETVSGTLYHVSSTGQDIVGFDPARDKLDLGDVSVHNFIVIDTPEGVAFMNPWSGEKQVIVGVSLGQLTIDSFAPIQNDHLRQDLSGALAWEHGVEPAAHTVYARSHEIGQIDRVSFDPATDVVDFRYYGTREQIYMVDGPEGVVIGNTGTGQALILLGVTIDQLGIENFLFHAAQVREDRVHIQLGFSSVPDSQILGRDDIPTAGTDDWPTAAGPGTPPAGSIGTTYAIEWHYGADIVLDFHPATDKLDFGWFKAPEFDIAEVNGSVVISITGNRQTYTLTGVSLADLDLNNVITLDTTARAEWQAAINAAGPHTTLPTLSVADATVTEGDTGTAMLMFTVTLSAASTSPVTVSYSTANGTAMAGMDYAAALGTLTFAPGETSKQIHVSVLNDLVSEANEAFTLQLSAPAGATIARGTATGTIVDNDEAPSTPPTLSIESVSTAEGDDGEPHMMFMVRLSYASTGTVTVHYSTADGTATAGADYEAVSGTLTFAPGQTMAEIHVPLIGDRIVEGNETFSLTLSTPNGATVANGVATGTIVDDDTVAPVLPTLSVADASVTEGNSGTKYLEFTVTLSAASASQVMVHYATGNGTATAGSDYTALSGMLTFAPGEISKVVRVPVTGDTAVEANETLNLTLSSPSGATIADGSAVGTIVNDDTATSPAGGTSVDYTVADNWGSGFVANMAVGAGSAAMNGWTVAFDASFTITNIWNAVIVSHVGNHYVIGNAAWNGSVAASGSTSFGFQATPGSGGTAAAGFLVNGAPVGNGGGEPEPVLPTLSVADASISEGNSGTTHLMFTVTLSAASTTPVTVGYATGNGTATAGADYKALTGTLTFAPGETSKVVHIEVNGDTVVEGNETLNLTLSSPSGATIADGTGVGTIVNDDTATPPAGGTSVDYTVADNWGSGFVANMAVGAGSAAMNGWTVAFDASFTITNIWNAVIVSHVGNHYVIGNAAWNGSIAASSSTSFGFQATPGSGGTAAAGFLVNGAPVGSGGGEPEPVLPALSVADASVSEGNSGTTHLMFTVTLSAASTTPVTVGYATGNGTATAGSDYKALTGTLTFAPGETSKVVHIEVNGDTVVEGNETLNLTLSSPSGATIADGSAVGTIVNDDVAAPLPTVSIAGASFGEGDAGEPGHGMFVVTLSAASTTPVTVAYTTANGTAIAGSDYVAQSGTITFAPGETTKEIHVTAIGDGVVEPNETFSVVLSAPSGATIATGTATGTIVNDDAPPTGTLPSLSIDDVTVTEGDPQGGAAAGGWLSTAGNQIVDADGNSVQIAGVNWFGFESSNLAPHGLWTRGYKDMMDQMVELGFNTIRLPFSSEMLHSTATPNGIDFSKNPDLQGLSALQIMDKIVDYAGEIGIKIILDHHRSDSGAGTSGNGLWYDSQHSEASWISDWQMLAERYADDPTVIGADLHNEPYNGTWGDGGVNDWARAATEAGNAIGDVNPNWLIFVEGIGTYQGENYWWGGNLMGVRDHPIELDVNNKLVYSAHDYPNSVYAQPWFQGSDFAEDLPAKFDEMWGYIYREGIAPVYVGEFGTNLTDPKDAPWLDAITAYMSGDFNNDGVKDIPAGDQGISWTFWSWNPNSGDTGGILNSDWTTVNNQKLAYLDPIMFDFDTDVVGGDDGGEAAPALYAVFTVSLSEASAEAVSVDFHTVPGTADASDFHAIAGTVTFDPGETTKTIAVQITPDTVGETDEMFSVVLDNAAGATIARGTGQATIADDDGGVTPPTGGDGGSGGSDNPGLGDDALAMSFDLVDSWNSGFNGSVTVENNGTAAVHGWQIEIEMPYEITNIWNAEIVSHDDDTYVIRNAAWNGDIAADGEISFGFTGTGAGNPQEIDFFS